MRGIIAPALWSESSKGNDHRGVEQSVARRAHNPKVGGSSPSPATISIAVVHQPLRTNTAA